MRTDFDKRTRALESKHHVGLAEDESAKTRAYYAKFSVDELRRLIGIGERNEAGSPPTPEEQSFLADLEARYGAF